MRSPGVPCATSSSVSGCTTRISVPGRGLPTVPRTLAWGMACVWVGEARCIMEARAHSTGDVSVRPHPLSTSSPTTCTGRQTECKQGTLLLHQGTCLLDVSCTVQWFWSWECNDASAWRTTVWLQWIVGALCLQLTQSSNLQKCKFDLFCNCEVNPWGRDCSLDTHPWKSLLNE